VHAFDATAIAMELGEMRLGNTVMLGAIADHLPFSADVLRDAILKRFGRKKPELVDLNRRAFEAGRAAVGARAAA
jgi:indolepyruvate ferredoxin oxidoreductase beta subunit